MDLARAPCRAPLTARKKGSGYENEVEGRNLNFKFDRKQLIQKVNRPRMDD